MTEYLLNRNQLKTILPSQLKLLEASFPELIDDSFVFRYKQMGYSVNDKADQIVDSKTQCISFFSGAGGLDIGAQLAGAKVISSLDFDKDSVSTMKANKYFNHTEHLLGDIKESKGKQYSKLLKQNNPEKLILIGGPPCQPFSKASYWRTHENRLGGADPRNMIGQYLRLIDELKPDGFLLENVESLLHPKNIEEVRNLEEVIDKLGYNFVVYKANSANFGVPQKRKRVFFLASKKPIIQPTPTHGTSKDILANPNLLPHEPVINWIGKFDDLKYTDGYDSTEGKYHLDLQDVPPGKNYIALTAKHEYPNPKFEAGKRYWSFLLKLHPMMPSWTIIASPGHWEGPFHWTNRRLRMKELAAIQTFPEDYTFEGSRRSIQKQIGNAVPSILGKAMVEHLVKHL